MGLLWLKRIDSLSKLIPKAVLDRGRATVSGGIAGAGRLVVMRPGGLGDFVILTHAAARLQLQPGEVLWIGEKRNAVWPALLGLECRCYDDLGFNLRAVCGRLGAEQLVCTEQTFGLAAAWGRRGAASDGRYLGFDSNRRADLFDIRVSYGPEYELESFTRLLAAACGRAPSAPLSPAELCRYYGLDLVRMRSAGMGCVASSANGGTERGAEQGRAVVALAGLQLSEKRLSVSQWQAVARRARNAHSRIVLLGAPGDRAVAEQIVGGLEKDSIENLVGELPFPRVVDVIAASDRVYSVDSGLIHAADFVGVPSEVMFPTGSSLKWGPRAIGSRIIEAKEIPDYLGQS